MNETNESGKTRVARAAGTVMLAFLLSQLIGLVAKILIAGSFSAGMELDAFYAANRPAETLVTIMAGGILVSSFIPIFIKFLVQNDETSAWKLASSTANLLMVVLVSLAGLVAIFAGPIVTYVLGAGFSPEKQALTVELLRIQSISIIFFGLSGLAVGVLNSHQKFLLPALAPAMYQLGQILGVLLLAPTMGIRGLAWGVVLGSLMNLLIQVPSIIKLHGEYSFSFGWHDQAVASVFRLMAPRMFGAAIVQLMLWVNTLLASNMPAGSVFSLTSGFSLMIMAQAAIAQSIATAVMPTLSAQFAQKKMDDFRKTLISSLRGVMLLSLPASIGLILLSVPLVTFLYQRGQFTSDTTAMVAWALTWYASGLVFHSLLEVLVRAYYAMHDTKTPVLIGAASMTLSILLSLLMSSLFTRLGLMPHGGLALAVSLSTALEVTVLFIILNKRLNGIHASELARAFLISLAGTGTMAFFLVVWMKYLSSHSAAVITLGGVSLGAGIYAVVLVILRVPEVHGLITGIKHRFQR